MSEILNQQNIFIILAITAVFYLLQDSLVTGLIWLFSQKLPWSQKRRVFNLPYPPGQLRQELIVNFQILILDAVLFVLVAKSFDMQPNAYTPLNFALTFAAVFVFFEAWFYFTHRALHHPRLYFIHRQHHTAKITSPLSAMSFSLLERVIQTIGALILPLLAAKYIGFICLEGILAYRFLNYVLNVIGHSNIETYPSGTAKSLKGKLLSGSAYHSLHHARFNGHYGLFSSVLDRCFKTYYHDYPEIQARVAQGQPLKKLNERLD